MSRSQNKISIPTAITVGAIAVIAIIASGVLRPAPANGGAPSGSPSTPPAPPSAPATPTPSRAPVDDFSDGSKSLTLDVAPRSVLLTVEDKTGTVVDATSGRAGDGMSVAWNDLKVENLDDRTLRLTWVGFPTDDPINLHVVVLDGEVTFVLFQQLPGEYTDALGFDRVLKLEFASPVRAEDFAVIVQDGMDTAD